MSLLALLAQAAPTGGTSALLQFAPIVLIFIVFYFLLIAPARKRQKQHEEMVRALGPGEKVVTNGGLVGHITSVSDKTLKLRIAPSVEVTLLRTHVAGKAEGDIQ